MATFSENFTRMRQDFDQSQDDRRRMFQETHAQVQQMAHGVRQQLAGFRQQFQQMRGEIAELTDSVRAELRDFGADLKAGGGIFRKQSNNR